MTAAVKNSLLLQALYTLFLGFMTAWQESAVNRFCGNVGVKLKTVWSSSVVGDVCCREGALCRAWSHSLSFRLLSGFVNLPLALCKWVYSKGQGLFDGSLAVRAVTGLGHMTWLLTGLFVLVMLVAPHESWDNLYAFLGAAALLGLFVLGSANRPKQRLALDRMGPYFALYASITTLGLVFSLSFSLSLRFYLFHLTCFFLATVLVSGVNRYQQLHATLTPVAIGLTIASLYGCYQGIVGVPVVASQQDMMLNKDMPGRIYSFFNNPNNFAEVLVMLTPLLLALFLNCKSVRGKVFSVLALIPCVGSLGMTLSRSSWIGMIIAVGVFIILQNWRVIPLFLILGLVSLPFLPESIINRILTIGNMKDSSALYRLSIYEKTGMLLKDYGTTGVGLGSDVMKAVFRHYPTLYDGNYPIHTHNNYFQMWGEVGIFGLLSFLAMMFSQLKNGVLTFYRTADRQVKNLLAASVGAMCGILFVGLVEYTWFYPRNMFLFWFLFAIIAAAIHIGSHPAAEK